VVVTDFAADVFAETFPKLRDVCVCARAAAMTFEFETPIEPPTRELPDEIPLDDEREKLLLLLLRDE
jgi:hypothetical protein